MLRIRHEGSIHYWDTLQRGGHARHHTHCDMELREHDDSRSTGAGGGKTIRTVQCFGAVIAFSHV